MPSLLGVPREIRDNVLSWVPLLPSPPPDPTHCQKADRTTLPRGYSGGWQATDRVWFERKPIPNPVLSVLLVNHQLHDEMKDILAKMPARPDYSLDIMFFKDDCTLWPTWTSVPTYSRDIDTLHVKFRVLHTPEHIATPVQGRGRNSPATEYYYRPGPGSPPPVYWIFYHPLAGFLKHGPWAKDHDIQREQGFTIQKLILEFLPATEPSILPVEPSRSSYDDFFAGFGRSIPQSPDESVRVAERLAGFVLHTLGLLLYMDRDRKYSTPLYERIGDIEVRVQEHLNISLDIPGRLEKAVWSTNYGPVTHKDNIVEKRRQAGLPIVS
jgi:hypothetical protein